MDIVLGDHGQIEVHDARWGYETPLAGSSPGWDRLCRFHRGLSFLVAGAAASVFLLLPAALILRLPDRFLLAVIALAYVFVLASLIRVWVMREHCPLSRGKLLAVTFECLICPPIAANLLRRLSLAVKVDQDAAAAAAQLLGQQAWDTARDAFVTRLRQQMELEEPGSARYEQLAARGGKLVLAESA